MRRDYRFALRVGLVGALVGVLVIVSGIYNVSARAGHFSATAWLLHFTMRQSARLHSLGIDPPPLDERARAERGAGHFAVGCAPCHGAPGDRAPRVSDYMTPVAPDLGPLVDGWQLRELYWVVANGIKYTGMPAWPTANRPDEVWDVVAFLRRLPDLDAASYRELAGAVRDPLPAAASGGDPGFAAALAECAPCHGVDGLGGPRRAYPLLAGQHEPYLLASLRAYASGQRDSGTMQLVAAGLDDAALRALALHYASRDARPVRVPPGDERLVARGAAIAAAGISERGVPDCNHCHGEPPVARNALMPRLAGQPREYLEAQLLLWRAGTRGGTPYAALMHAAAQPLRVAEIRSLAAYYEVLRRQPHR